jgi:hypothetical protein
MSSSYGDHVEPPPLHGVEEVVINKEVVAGSARPVNVYAKSARDGRAGCDEQSRSSQSSEAAGLLSLPSFL